MQVANDVLQVLSRLECAGNTARISGQLPRDLYLKVNKVLEACGGVWNRKAKVHVFEADTIASERIDQIIISGEVTTAQDLGFFPTPAPIARKLVELANVQPEDFVLEPSAGDGAIVEALIEARAGVLALERDANRRAQLTRRFVDTTRVAVMLPWTHAHEIDFLDYIPDEPFDRVVMNPPFCKVGAGDHLDHVRHAHGMLIPGGSLVSVLPAGIKFRADKRHAEFREWFMDLDGTVIDLPDDAFKASGTRVRTVVLALGSINRQLTDAAAWR